MQVHSNGQTSAPLTSVIRKSYQEVSFNNPNSVNAQKTQNFQGGAYYTDPKLPQTSRSKPTASFGQSFKSPEEMVNIGMVSNRSQKTQDETEFDEDNFEDYRETEDEMENLQALMGPSTKKSKKSKDISENFSDGDQSRDVLLLRCRDAIEELHTEIEGERNQKIQLQ